MEFNITHIHIIGLGLLCIVVIGIIIKKQNDILIQHSKKNGYTAYNNAANKTDANNLMNLWQNNPVYFMAVKKIVFTDYVWMVFFGGTILYGLSVGYYYSGSNWNLIFIGGMVLLILAVAMDIIQDNGIYQHLTKNRFSDLRYLTKPKFAILIIAIVTALIGIIKNWNVVLNSAFWKMH